MYIAAVYKWSFHTGDGLGSEQRRVLIPICKVCIKQMQFIQSVALCTFNHDVEPSAIRTCIYLLLCSKNTGAALWNGVNLSWNRNFNLKTFFQDISTLCERHDPSRSNSFQTGQYKTALTYVLNLIVLRIQVAGWIDAPTFRVK